jgi:hypothetical protein
MDSIPSVDDMWEVIESFGIKREILDLRKNLTHEEIQNLYFTIKNRNSSTEGNNKKNQ